jgi:hypothetical protein
VKSRFITYIAVIAVASFTASFAMPLAAQAAENGFGDRPEVRQTQQTVLPENGVNNLTSQPPRVSRQQAMNIASDRYEGRVLSIRQDNNNWRVRMDREGTVFNVFVNSTSGDVSASSD